MNNAAIRVVVLISGKGSNLQALIDFQKNTSCRYQIVKVISNRPDVYGLQRAATNQIDNEVIDHRLYNDRPQFEQALINSIDQVKPDLVVLAGFMRILTPLFTQHYLGRMFNIHPSLLPKYPGLDTHQRALDAGDTQHGLSIHFVTAELDGGPIVMQASTAIEPTDKLETLQQKVHQLEHRAYPLAVNLFAQGLLTFQHHQAWWHGQPLLSPLQFEDFTDAL